MSKLPELIELLLNPKVYPHKPRQIELMQTQMSFILVAGEYVYKVKKPVNLGYLDYTTLDKRRYCCEKEVELNRRLCPEVYLGVIPIVKGNGISIGGEGRAIEYAVKMRYLSREAMMDTLLAANRVSPGMVTKLARKLVAFHQRAETNPAISAFGSLDSVLTNAEENFVQTEKYIGVSLSRERYQNIRKYTSNFTKERALLFNKRVEEGRIRDCHGDLHAAHVCFADRIYIYDCIEFNDRFRYCDVASEIAFLAMDLDRYGRADLSASFVDAYVAVSRDRELRELLDFYKCYRAYVRGKVEGFKLDDPHISEQEKAKALAAAKRYFELAESYVKTYLK